MTGLHRWPNADDLLDRALALAPAERRAFIRREAEADLDFAAALEAVLDEAERKDTFLDPDTGARELIAHILANSNEEAAPALRPGELFTSYEVIGLVGQGGMGEVYKARDERLGRLVALKVLPDAFVNDRQRLARFDREARLLASLNHPNIAAIYGLAEDRGRQALVLEFVEGVTLADRLTSGPFPVRSMLPIAMQVALALETAHRRGIVHRDLKPGNISLTPDGTVKVLDFGLAKAVDGRVALPADAIETTIAHPGQVIGTPAYMSPEQARGEEIDKRSDVWAFGCLVFEMLTGTRAFTGESPQEVLARVLERDPDFSLLPMNTPEPITRLLHRTLTKDPHKRLADLGDAVLDLEEAEASLSRGTPAWPRLTGRRPAVRLAVGAGLLLAGIGAGILVPRLLTPTVPAAPIRLAVPVPASDELIASAHQVAALTPDGRTIVYRANRAGTVRLFRRSLGGMTSEPIPGTENAAGPFFSPDGEWIGFDGDGVLQKVALAGGSPLTICPAPGGAHASWGADTIVFATSTTRVLQRVAAAGGVPEPLTILDAAAGDIAHTFPNVLPDGTAALFTIVRANERHLAAVHFDTRKVHILTPGSQPRYVAGGYILFVRDDSIWSARFDAQHLRITSDAEPVLEGLETGGGSAAHFALTPDGSLLYAPRREEERERALVWVSRDGSASRLPLSPGRYTRAALSPDGAKLALAMSDQNNTDVWIAGSDQQGMTRLTREPTVDTAPLWTRDGTGVVFRSERDGGGLFLQSLAGTAPAHRLSASGDTLHTPHGWTPDGQTLLFTEFRSYTQQTIAAVTPAAPAEPVRILQGSFAQLRPQVSPDGRWLAYQSDESGQFEVYVRPFPDVAAGKWKISISGGTSPRWAHRTHELFYYDGKAIVAVPLRRGADFATGPPQRLFDFTPFTGRVGPDFEVAPDDQRFLLIRSENETPSNRLQLVIVQNWMTELRHKLGQ